MRGLHNVVDEHEEEITEWLTRPQRSPQGE
jgi:hypothetical protein